MFLKALLPLIAATLSTAVSAQSISPSVIGSAGGSGTTGGVTLDWTVGETAVTTVSNGTNSITQGFHQADPVKVKLNIDAFLQGPYDNGTGKMIDALRTNGLIPLTEPYTALGYSHVGGGGETTTLGVLATAGDNAIIDWVIVELRDKNDNTNVLATSSALVQADGDVVGTDGTSPVALSVSADSYYLSIQHRNHLSIMTFFTIPFSSTATTVNFTDGSTATYGSDAQQLDGGVYKLWSGDVTYNGVVQYTGSGNDRDPILVEIGGAVPTNTTTGYKAEDVNLDGTVKYTGTNNDRDPILVNIGGAVPTNTRVEQMP